ncbi:hypothetical protein SR870_05155 [Rhodopseudomonas palustris]|uniref:hypothetical protein n=1 Tax=Rhodopseudomonas palustris TaxID=1076 RepID=UPI002ACE347E|nr:hypothetical protein [Rhodopseudomonas palustris]WQH00673.1 hypothetical protein SR870_05155 [Rhodopseudomonas palustris]
MTDRDKNPDDKGELSRRLDERVSGGRITQAESDVILRFFASTTEGRWPASNLQRRMQSSGG